MFNKKKERKMKQKRRNLIEFAVMGIFISLIIPINLTLLSIDETLETRVKDSKSYVKYEAEIVQISSSQGRTTVVVDTVAIKLPKGSIVSPSEPNKITVFEKFSDHSVVFKFLGIESRVYHSCSFPDYPGLVWIKLEEKGGVL